MRFLRTVSVFRLVFAIVLASVGLGLGYGAEPIRLAAVPTLSPDGKILYFSWNGDLWRVPTEGGVAEPLTRHPADENWAACSPDGTRLAFTGNRDGSNRIWVMPVAGGAPEAVSINTDGGTPLGWYPDGSALLIAANRDSNGLHSRRLYRLPVAGGREELLFDAYADWGQLSPDGTRVLFVRNGVDLYRKGYRGSLASRIWMHDLRDGSFTLLCDDDTGARRPLWRPDGQAFYFVSQRDGCFNLWERDLAAGTDRQITRHTGDGVIIPGISADGSVIVYRQGFAFYRVHPGADEEPKRIDIVHDSDRPVETGKRRWYQTAWNNDANGSVDFTKDGLEIVFTAGGDLWVMDTVLKEPRQVAGDTATHETEAIWIADGGAVLFLSDRGDRIDLCKATRAKKDLYWWQNERFVIERLTDDESQKQRLSRSPDGNRIAFVRGLTELCVAKSDGTEVRAIHRAFRYGDYDWSPDGKWLAAEVVDSDGNTDVWIVATEGDAEPYNLSRHPDRDADPRWSPDGTMLAYSVTRGLNNRHDIATVSLTMTAEEEDAWYRTYGEALTKVRDSRQKKEDKPAPAAGEGDSGPVVTIDFRRLWERVKLLPLNDSSESSPFWWPKGKVLGFTSDIGGRRGTYKVTFPDSLTPEFVTGDTGSQVRGNGEDIVWLCNGKPARLAKGKSTFYDFKAYQDTDLQAYRRLGFRQAWRTMRDQFHDPNLNNLDWNAVLAKYEDVAATAPDAGGYARVMSMMLGELNASHMGYTSETKEWKEWEANPGWSIRTDHLGLFFDRSKPGPGLTVDRVVPNGPADRPEHRVRVGERVLTLNGTELTPETDLDALLTGVYPKTVRLTVADTEGAEREILLRPVSYGDIRTLLRDAWIDRNRAMVEEQSNGELAYVHIDRMQWAEFHRFQQEVYSLGYGRKGLVVDVRSNSGGFTADHLLTVLSRPQHAITIPRGGEESYLRGYLVYSSWDKPVVLLCNEYTASNAEILCHAVKGLKRGKIVGMPTGGQVIATGSRNILDLGTLRVPERSWFAGYNGQDMEMGGVEPDVVVRPEPGEIPAGIDRQLNAAVQVLVQEIRETPGRVGPKPIRYSER